jgi:hypothetical protein
VRKRTPGLILAVLALTFGFAAPGQPTFFRLRGPYLGQKPPGLIPEPFAPGVVTTTGEEGGCAFARNGTVFLFQKFVDGRCRTFVARQENGAWSAPELVPFWESLAENGDFAISSDDETMFYQVRKDPRSGPPSQIWQVKIAGSGWGEQKPLPAPVNSLDFESYASDTSDGTLYFFSGRPGGKGGFDLYASASRAGGYADPVNLASLNTEYDEWDPFVAPDESYLLFCSTKPGGLGRDDIYVSFRGEDGRWGSPMNLGPGVNSTGSENRLCVTRDGKYLFFTSTRDGSRDVFWVRAEALDKFKR